jgi:ABC-type Zn2+ transport system substrate-binding protein/surface adhesin
MNDMFLYSKLSILPENLKSEVSDFIDSLVAKDKKTSEKKKPILGSGKGIFVMHDDFDEPLEDFKDYI